MLYTVFYKINYLLMANFLAVYDPNDERRCAFENKCMDKIAIFENLKRDQLSTNSCTILWAANPKAPIDTSKNENEVAVVLGDAIRPGSSERVTAKKLSGDWKDLRSAKTHYYDGYYCALRFSFEEGLIVGGDILGLFPIYYYSDGEIIITASSPELFRYHDCFNPKLSVEGLTGMLITMHSVEGLSLWENVHRLKAGHILAAQKGKAIKECSQYQLPLSEKYYDLPFSHQVELVHKKMKNAVSRHAPANHKYSFLFSGGLDTRMLAGYLQNSGKDITAITLGKATDMEMKIAKKTVNALPFQHRVAERDFSNYKNYANLSARWEHGLHGFNTVQYWGLKEILDSEDASRIISGVHHDGILSGSYANYLEETDSSKQFFSKIYAMVTEWGIPVDVIDELLTTDYDKSVGTYIAKKLETRFYSYSASNYKRAWCFNLYHRGRFHHGGMIWKMSFGAWPTIPIIDSTLLELLAGLPSATKSNRRAQRALVATFFPKLARIPLDNNSNKPEQLIPTWQSLLWEAITKPNLNRRIVEAINRRRTGPWYKNLFYHRVFDINNKGWRNIRREAEEGRPKTSDIFNQEKLGEIVPPPEKNIEGRLGAVSGTKSLLGFLLWLKQH